MGTIVLNDGAPNATVTITGTDPAGVDHYVATRSVAGGGYPFTSGAGVRPSSGFIDSTVAYSTTYTYTVTSYTAANAFISNETFTKTIGPSSGPAMLPSVNPPTSLTVTPSGSTFNLAWTASTSTAVSGYQIRRNGVAVATATATATSYTDGGARPLTYQVAALKISFTPSGTAYSAASNAVTILMAPYAPTLTGPTNATYTDLATTGGPFAWTYNNDDGSTQQSYQFRRKISGAGAYEYWNAGTGAFQSTPVDNTSTSGSLTFSAGIFTDGNVYNWSVNTTSSAGMVGVFASDLTVSASATPSVTVTSPAATLVTTTPTVSWIATIQTGMGETQTAYQVWVESGAFGAVPGSGANVYSSGLLGGAASSLLLPSLIVATPYRVYVQVTVTGGQVSTYGTSSFTITADPLAAPALTGYYDTTGQRCVLLVQGRDNLLSTDGGSFEASTGGWVAGPNTTIALSSAQAALGLTSLAVTATAAGVASVSQSVVTVSPGQTYTALGSSRAAVAGRTVTVQLAFLDGAAAVLGSSSGTAFDGSTGWVQATATAVAPVGTASVRMTYSVDTSGGGGAVSTFTGQLGTVASRPGNIILGSVAAAGGGSGSPGEVHYLDNASIAPGSSAVWGRGGIVGAVVAVVERSSDGGASWVTIRNSGPTIPSPAQQVTVYDVEPAPNSTVLYRVRGTMVM